jgi:predicted acylesterase/phospholipase RssA
VATLDPAARVRIGVVLSAGGLRGVAHLGVMRRLLGAAVPIDVIVGVSAGAIIAGYYAGVGLSIEDMIGDAPQFRGRHVLMHGMTLRAPRLVRPFLRRFCGIIPRRLKELEAGRFDPLHHGVRALGVVCHDCITNRAVYFSSVESFGVRLSDVVKASAAVPGLIPTRPVAWGDRVVHLVDGGVSDGLPTRFARTDLGATHLIVSDCRRVATSTPTPDDERIVYIRPSLNGAGSWQSPRGTLSATVVQGEAAVTDEILARVRRWYSSENGAPQP